MQKIPTLFKRDEQDRRYVTDEVTPGCEWVLAGEGVATRKYDGTCVMLDEGGQWWARREVKPGKTPPPNFMRVNFDEITGKVMGWEPIEQSSFAKAFAETERAGFVAGTYELVGPKVNGNPESFDSHALVRHADAETLGPEFETLRTFKEWASAVTMLGHAGWEGIVWHHPDGRMAKLKARDLR